MGTLARSLDAEAPSGGGKGPEHAIDRALRELSEEDSDALRRALWDFDEQLGQYRVSHRRLAAFLVEAGYQLQHSGVAVYRITRGR